MVVVALLLVGCVDLGSLMRFRLYGGLCYVCFNGYCFSGYVCGLC